MDKKKVVCIVQARIGSTRLPGKMLQLLGEHTLLEWVLLRVKRANLIDLLVLATTDNECDNEIANDATKLGINVFRGSEQNVLSRFVEVSELYSSDIVIRVCADNPFIASEEIDRLIMYFTQSDCDYACNHRPVLDNQYADGFGAEIFSKKILMEIVGHASSPAHFEHVTAYLWENQDTYKLCSFKAPAELAHPELKFDIDTEGDLNYLNLLVKDHSIGIDTPAADIVKFCINAKNK
jgi:spore coat polysaccharide biosynthesis protein SpsF